MTNSRAKGYRGEAELVDLLYQAGYHAKRTAAMQAGDDESFPDVTATHQSTGAQLAIEVKNRKTLPPVSIQKALAQSDAAYPGSRNVARLVAIREQGKKESWVCVIRLPALLELLASVSTPGKASQ